MGALHLLSYVAGVAAFLFILLSLASGLLYVAEVIEEHSGTAKAIGQRTIYAIILLLVVMYFTDGLPAHISGLLIFAHLVYLQNFARTWPSISLSSPTFILSCILVIVSHFVSFAYFSDKSHQPRKYNSGSKKAWNRGGTIGGSSTGDESFLDVATFFGICVWLVPFYLFLSLSANDNVLPSAGDLPATPTHPNQPQSYHARKNSSMMKSALSSAFSLFLRKNTGSNQRDGLIAQVQKSRPSSPLFSPSLNSGGGSPWGSNSPPPPRSPGLGGYPGYSAGNSPTNAYGGAVDRRPSVTPRMPPMPPRRATEGNLVPHLPSPMSIGEVPLRPRPPPLSRRPSMEPAYDQRIRRDESPPLFSPASPPLMSPLAQPFPEGLVKRKATVG